MKTQTYLINQISFSNQLTLSDPLTQLCLASFQNKFTVHLQAKPKGSDVMLFVIS